jgi:hypothetical protein
MTASTEREPMHPPGKGLHVGLWIAPGLLALTFVGGGLWKVATPVPELASKMPWIGQVLATFFYATAVIDSLGGLGPVLQKNETQAPP